jgi:hypothetical protein
LPLRASSGSGNSYDAVRKRQKIRATPSPHGSFTDAQLLDKLIATSAASLDDSSNSNNSSSNNNKNPVSTTATTSTMNSVTTNSTTTTTTTNNTTSATTSNSNSALSKKPQRAYAIELAADCIDATISKSDIVTQVWYVSVTRYQSLVLDPLVIGC